MKRLVLTLSLLLIATAAAAGDKPPDPAALKAKIEREQDPVKRADLRMQLAGLRLGEAKQQYDAMDDDKGLATLREMRDLVDGVEQDLFGTGRDPRKKPKGFKESEIKLREMLRRLQDLRLTVPADERPPIEEIMKRFGDIQEEFLYGIMRVKDPQARAQAPKEPKP